MSERRCLYDAPCPRVACACGRVHALSEPGREPAWVPWPTHQGPWWMRWKASGASMPVVAWSRGASFCVEVPGKEEGFFPGSFTAEVEFAPAVPPRMGAEG